MLATTTCSCYYFLFMQTQASPYIRSLYIACSNFTDLCANEEMDFPWYTYLTSNWEGLLSVLLNFFKRNLIKRGRKEYGKKPAIQMHKNTHSMHNFNSNSNPVSGATIVRFFFSPFKQNHNWMDKNAISIGMWITRLLLLFVCCLGL